MLFRSKVKTKVAFNLTKRQLVCFTGGALIGVPLFFLLRGPVGNSVAAMCMMLVMLPFFMLAMYEKHGQPLEKIVGNIIRVTVIRPKERPYRTNNFYAVLQRQANLDEEVDVYKRQTLQRMVDREAKRAEGKGVGYDRWAAKHNLKQMAATVTAYQQYGFRTEEHTSELQSQR